MRISVTSRSSSVWDTLGANSFRLDDARNRDDHVPAHDERPRLACGTRDLGVDEHVLDLLRPPGEPVAGTPGSYLKAWEVRFDGPVAPVDETVQRDGRALEPDLVVLARGDRAAAEVEPPRADRRVEQLGELRRHRAAKRKAVEVLPRRGMEASEEREDLLADQPARGVPVRRVDAEGEPLRAAVRRRPLAPAAQQRANDA